jgi:para-nitrobenzyl esterase
VVITDYGAVRGVQQGATYAYKGIPYAAPPVGPLRFRPPQPPACWEGEHDASSFGPRCWQKPLLSAIDGDEDCLLLNVWAPTTPGTPRPVMFYMHGGGNSSGTSGSGGDDDPLFDGKPLVEQADVVVVTVSYRVGALGFLAHPALAAEDADGSTGNYGLLDQIAALQWVKDNIDAFGGDPDQVMVFGESAGAIDTCALMASPLASGLMTSALMQSGACVSRTIADRQAFTDSLVAEVACDGAADVVACMRAVDPQTLIEAQQTLTAGSDLILGLHKLPFGPTVDGHVLLQDPEQALEDGNAAAIPFVVGSNADETRPSVPLIVTLANYEQRVDDAFGTDAPTVLAHYNPTNYGTSRQTLMALSTDVNFTCPARRAARAARTHHPDVYRYWFTHALDGGPAQGLGAFHALELYFVFQQESFEFYDFSPSEITLSQNMLGYWTRFAIGHDPNGGGATAWPAYDATTDPAIVLDTTISTITNIRTAGCDVLDAVAP